MTAGELHDPLSGLMAAVRLPIAGNRPSDDADDAGLLAMPLDDFNFVKQQASKAAASASAYHGLARTSNGSSGGGSSSSGAGLLPRAGPGAGGASALRGAPGMVGVGAGMGRYGMHHLG